MVRRNVPEQALVVLGGKRRIRPASALLAVGTGPALVRLGQNGPGWTDRPTAPTTHGRPVRLGLGRKISDRLVHFGASPSARLHAGGDGPQA